MARVKLTGRVVKPPRRHTKGQIKKLPTLELFDYFSELAYEEKAREREKQWEVERRKKRLK